MLAGNKGDEKRRDFALLGPFSWGVICDELHDKSPAVKLGKLLAEVGEVSA